MKLSAHFTKLSLGLVFGLFVTSSAVQGAKKAALSSDTGACGPRKPAWYFHSMNQKSVIDYTTEDTGKGVIIHRWYIRPENHGAGNHLTIVYKEDPKLSRLNPMKSLVTDGAKKYGGFYFTCYQAPVRYFFASGYYHTEFDVANYESCDASCSLVGVTPLDLSKVPGTSDTVKEGLKNPNLGAAFAMMAKKNKGAGPEIAKAAAPSDIPESRVARKNSGSELDLQHSNKPAKGTRMGSYRVTTKMPDEVMAGQVSQKGEHQ